MKLALAHPSINTHRRAALAITALLLGSGVILCHAASGPANDDLANAEVIAPTASFSVKGSDEGSTQEAFEQAPGYPAVTVHTVWYSWTSPVSGDLRLSFERTGGDTAELTLFEGPNASADSFLGKTAPGALATPDVAITAGQEYLISVGNTSSPGTFTLLGKVENAVTPPFVVPVVSVAVEAPQVIRGSGAKGKFLLQLSTPAAADLILVYKLGGTASNGVDYKLLSGAVTVPSGKTEAAVKVKPLATDEAGDVKVKLTLLPGSGYTVGSVSLGKIKIVSEP